MKEHDPKHPYVRKMVGCGHGVLFTDYCKDCEIVSVQERYKTAIRTVQHCRNELRRLGVSVPGQTSLPVHQPVQAPAHEGKPCPTCESLVRSVMLAAPMAPAHGNHFADDRKLVEASAVAEPTSYSHLAEQVSRLMTIGGATITERQQDVLAAALKALEVGMPTRYPITPERVTPDMRTDDEKLADLRGNPPVADYEHKKPDDTEGGAL